MLSEHAVRHQLFGFVLLSPHGQTNLRATDATKLNLSSKFGKTSIQEVLLLFRGIIFTLVYFLLSAHNFIPEKRIIG